MVDPVSAGIAVGGSLINGLLQGDQNAKNRKWQSKENQKARDYNTEMYRVFNMGIGLVLALRPAQVDSALKILKANRERAAVIGWVEKSNRERVRLIN